MTLLAVMMPGVERDLVARAVAGESSARARFVETVRGPVARYVARMVGDPERAADLAQETYLRLLAALPGFGGRSEPSTWAIGIAANVCREEFRRRRGRPVALPEEPVDRAAETPAAAASRRETADVLAAAIDDLPAGEREVLVLRASHGYDYQRIALATGRSLADVKVSLHRARRRLLARLAEDDR